jgi:hypothetical protein
MDGSLILYMAISVQEASLWILEMRNDHLYRCLLGCYLVDLGPYIC